jgi:hypothetical protein
MCPDQLLGPPRLLSIGHQGSFPRGKEWQGHDADHSPPSLVLKSRMSRSYTSSPISACIVSSGKALVFIGGFFTNAVGSSEYTALY